MGFMSEFAAGVFPLPVGLISVHQIIEGSCQPGFDEVIKNRPTIEPVIAKTHPGKLVGLVAHDLASCSRPSARPASMTDFARTTAPRSCSSWIGMGGEQN